MAQDRAGSRPAPGASTTAGADKHRRHYVAGLAAPAQDVRVRRGRLRVETLSGRAIPMRRAIRTGRSGGVFLTTESLPKRFVVSVELPKGRSGGLRGTLRSFAERRNRAPVGVSFGSTAAVAIYRAHHGKYSVRKAQRRATAALKLPTWTRLGYEDRVSRRYVSRAVLKKKSGGNLDAFAQKIARRERKGQRVALYKGDGWTIPRTVHMLPSPRWARPDRGRRQVAGSLSTVGSILSTASDINTAVVQSQNYDSLTQEMAGLTGQVQQIQQQLVDINTNLSHAEQNLAVELAATNYQISASALTDDFNVHQALEYLATLQGGPSCGNNCTQEDMDSYDRTMSDFEAGNGATSGGYIAQNANTIMGNLFGTGNILDLAFTMVQQAQVAGNAGTQDFKVSPNLLTSIISNQYVSYQQYWTSYLYSLGVVVANIQENPSSCMPNLAGTPPVTVTSGTTNQYDITAAPEAGGLGLVWVAYENAQALIPPPVPVGTIWDGSTNDLWASLGDRMLNDDGGASVTNLATGVSQQTSAQGALIPAFTVDSSTWVPDSGATLTASQLQGSPFTAATGPSVWNLASLYLSSAGAPSTWASASLGDMVAGTPGLTGQFPGTNWQTVWNALTNLPLASQQTMTNRAGQTTVTGQAGAPTGVTQTVQSTDPATGLPVSTQYWYLAGPAGQLSPGVYSSATWAYDTSYGSGLYLVVQGGGMASSVSNTWNYPAYGIPNMLVFMQYGNPEYTVYDFGAATTVDMSQSVADGYQDPSVCS